MAIYRKISTSDDIINGLVTVMNGVTVSYRDPSPEASGGGLIYTQHLASGDSLRHFQTLDLRYRTGPSGTWE